MNNEQVIQDFCKSYFEKKEQITFDEYENGNRREERISPSYGGTYESLIMPHKRLQKDIFPESLRNKKIDLGNGFFVHCVYTERIEKDDKENRTNYSDYYVCHWYTYHTLTFVVEYHGFYTQGYLQSHSNSLSFYEITNPKKYDRYVSNNVLTYETRWVPKEHNYSIECRGALFAEKFMNDINWSNLNVIGDTNIKFTEKYCFSFVDDLNKLTLENVDYKFFIQKDVDGDVYKPSKSFVKQFDLRGYMGLSYKAKFSFPKNLLHELGVKKVHLKDGCYFDILGVFNMKGIEIKAGKKILEIYPDFYEYVKDDKVKKEYDKGIEEEKRKKAEEEYNDTYTLVFHGKIVLTDVRSYDIIEYLQTVDNGSVQDQLKEICKKIFDEYDIKQLCLGRWGTYYKYECAGEKKIFEYELKLNPEDDVNDENDVIQQINDSYIDKFPGMSDRQMEDIFGWPDRGGYELVAKKNGRKIELEVIDCDFE